MPEAAEIPYGGDWLAAERMSYAPDFAVPRSDGKDVTTADLEREGLL